VEIFEDLVLEADFTDLTILHTAFYEGLKWDMRHNMVGKTPDTLAELKALAIQLDEECMGADCRETQTTGNRTAITDSNETTCPTTLQVKSEVARVGTGLSTDDRAWYLHGRAVASDVVRLDIVNRSAQMESHKRTSQQSNP
jgi:hypothetical protein